MRCSDGWKGWRRPRAHLGPIWAAGLLPLHLWRGRRRWCWPLLRVGGGRCARQRVVVLRCLRLAVWEASGDVFSGSVCFLLKVVRQAWRCCGRARYAGELAEAGGRGMALLRLLHPQSGDEWPAGVASSRRRMAPSIWLHPSDGRRMAPQRRLHPPSSGDRGWLGGSTLSLPGRRVWPWRQG